MKNSDLIQWILAAIIIVCFVILYMESHDYVPVNWAYQSLPAGS